MTQVFNGEEPLSKENTQMDKTSLWLRGAGVV